MGKVLKVRVLGGDDEVFTFPGRQVRSKLGEVVEFTAEEAELLTADGVFDKRFQDPPSARRVRGGGD